MTPPPPGRWRRQAGCLPHQQARRLLQGEARPARPEGLDPAQLRAKLQDPPEVVDDADEQNDALLGVLRTLV